MDHDECQRETATSGCRTSHATARGSVARAGEMGVYKPQRVRRSARYLGVLGSVIVSLGGTVAAAQQSEDPRPQRASLAYFGERAVQPGLRIGYEAAAWQRRPHELLLAGNISGFAIPSGYALMALFEGGYRVTARFGGFLDVRPGLGYTAAWLETGGPPIVSNYITLSALGGVGYDFFRLLKVPLSVMVRSGVLWRYELPHTTGAGPLEGASYALDIGLAYQFGTTRPKPIALPTEVPPFAEAPANLDEPGTTVPTANPTSNADHTPPTPPASPTPPTPNVPTARPPQ